MPDATDDQHPTAPPGPPRDPDGDDAELLAALASSDPDEVFGALTAIGKRRRTHLEPSVVPFLDHRSGMVRGRAAWTLGFQLQRGAHLSRIRLMAMTDPDPEAREDAIAAWAMLRRGTRDRDALDTFDRWLRDGSEPYLVRAAAFLGLLQVSGLPRNRWPRPASFDDLDRQVPWDLVAEMTRPG